MEQLTELTGRERIISNLTCESIAFTALNARCKRARHNGGPILDSDLNGQHQTSMAHIDSLLDQLLEERLP